MSYVTGIDVGGEQRAAESLDFSGPRGTFPLVRYDLARLKREIPRDEVRRGPTSIWRYWMLLPADAAHAVTMGEGMTPLIRLHMPGLDNLWMKDEGQNPSGSFKDRGASAGFSRYRELGVKALAMHSTGNAGAAWALYAARAGIKCINYLPLDGQASTRQQCAAAGAEVRFIEDWPNAGRIVAAECAARGWLNVSGLKEPYRIEGKKTLAFEIAEQFDWKLPDVIVFPTGGGQAVIAIYKGFAELRELGWISGPDPRLVITQYAGCAPVVKAYVEGRRECEPWSAKIDIVPGGMKSPDPISGAAILDILRRTGGAAVAVGNDEALAAAAELCRKEGLFLGPEAATGLVGVRKAVESGAVQPASSIVLVGTGSGLKSLSLLTDPLPQ